MAADLDALMAANARFYERFEALELDGMEEVWDHSDEVWCVHPGTDLIRGWPAVRRSWAALFASTPYLQFIVTDVVPLAEGTAGVLHCTENVLTRGAGAGELGGGKAVATNVFARRDERWLMVAHHASPVLRRDIEGS